MHVDGISFQFFRNTPTATYFFPKQTTAIVGHNAAGKTSIIEAINLLSTGSSFRAEHVEEMITLGQEIGRVKGKVTTEQRRNEDDEELEHAPEKIELEITMTRGMVQGKRAQSSLYAVNGVRRRKKDFVGQFFSVVFRPEDMRLIEGSPGRRRQFFDTVLATLDREYASSLKTYEEGLKKRNRLLSQVQEGNMPASVLSFWTELLIKHGMQLQEKRRQFFAFFSSVAFPVQFSLKYQPSVISRDRMAEYSQKEIAAGHTLIGPHKDDFIVEFGLPSPHPIHTYGSRGQQRLAVIWLKICEFEYILKETLVRPILLLDDILSELDETHREHVFSLLQRGQSIITTTEEKMVEELQKQVDTIDVIHLESREEFTL